MPTSALHSFVLNYLADHDRVDLIELAKLAGVTQQTLRSELAAIEAEVASDAPCLVELSSRYVEVADRTALTRFLAGRRARTDLSAEGRIVLALVLSPDYVPMRRIAAALFMSRSSVEKHLSRLVREGRLRVETSRQRGVRLMADVRVRYSMFVRIMRPYVRAADLRGSLRSFAEEQFPLDSFMEEGDVDAALAFVDEVGRRDSALYVPDSVEELLCHALVLRWCVRRGVLLSSDALIPKDDERDLAHYQEVVDGSCAALGEDVPLRERLYLAQLLMSLRKTCTHDNDWVIRRMAPFVLSIVDEVRRRYAIDLSGDEKLVEGLALHVWTTVIRGVSLASEPALYPVDELRRAYPLGFELAAIAAELIERRYGYLPQGTEVAYIALHLQAALERMGFSSDRARELRVLIVCHYGLAASNLIAERLERTLPDLRVVGLYALAEYQGHLDECDAIVSTEPLEEDGRPVFYVTPMLHEAELVPIRRFLEGRDRFDSRMAVTLLESVVVDLSACASPEEAVRALSGALCERGCVDERYGESVLRRERVSPTSLDVIAIPHGDPELVTRTRLAVGRAPQGIAWAGSTVYLVLMLAFSSEGFAASPRFFSSFYRRLARPETERGLRGVADLPDAECRRGMVRIVLGTRGGESWTSPTTLR